MAGIVIEKKVSLDKDNITYSIIVDGRTLAKRKIMTEYTDMISKFDRLVELFKDFYSKSLAHNFMLFKSHLTEFKESGSSLYFIINNKEWAEVSEIDESDKDSELLWTFENVLMFAIMNIKEL